MKATLYQNWPGKTKNWTNLHLDPHDYRIYYVNIDLRHQYGISADWDAVVPPRETSPAGRSEKKELFSQATVWLIFSILPITRVPNRFFGIRDFPYLKLGIRDFEANSRQDSGVKVCATYDARNNPQDYGVGRKFGSGLRDWRTLLGTLNYVPLYAMELKKLLCRLVNNNITASCQINMSPKHYIKPYKGRKRTLKKCYANKFQQATIPIRFIFSKIVHPCLLLHFLFSCLLQIGGSSQCLNFDKLHNAAPLPHKGLF